MKSNRNRMFNATIVTEEDSHFEKGISHKYLHGYFKEFFCEKLSS